MLFVIFFYIYQDVSGKVFDERQQYFEIFLKYALFFNSTLRASRTQWKLAPLLLNTSKSEDSSSRHLQKHNIVAQWAEKEFETGFPKRQQYIVHKLLAYIRITKYGYLIFKGLATCTLYIFSICLRDGWSKFCDTGPNNINNLGQITSN